MGKLSGHILKIPFIALLVTFSFTLLFPLAGDPSAMAEEQAAYVGAEKCKECHEEIYQSYKKGSQKAHSYASIKKLMPQLTPEEIKGCYACHTTGYGRPGGFVSEQQTPQMANAGCEVCHGPGGKHVRTESSEDIKGKLQVKDCETCHNEERVGSFKYKPLIYGGGH